MNRRAFFKTGLATLMTPSILHALQHDKLDAAADVLRKAAESGRLLAASLHVRRGDQVFAKSFGAAKSADAIFLLASITKPMSVAALMTLYDRGEFRLEDLASKFIPEFTVGGRERITIVQLLTHVSGLPDQLPENESLRKRHAGLPEFVERAVRTPLLFEPGSRYRYSSMGILLASEIARRVTGRNFAEFVNESLFRPLGMNRSVLGLGPFKLSETIRCQVESAAPESGAGDPSANEWDWNSPFWRNLGAPWGGAHGSAADVARFLGDFLRPSGKVLKPETSRLMLRNHNHAGLTPRGLGFQIGSGTGSPGCSELTFGHSGSTGTLVWADPATDTICVVLTTLPAGAARPHPRDMASDLVAQAAP